MLSRGHADTGIALPVSAALEGLVIEGHGRGSQFGMHGPLFVREYPALDIDGQRAHVLRGVEHGFIAHETGGCS